MPMFQAPMSRGPGLHVSGGAPMPLSPGPDASGGAPMPYFPGPVLSGGAPMSLGPGLGGLDAPGEPKGPVRQALRIASPLLSTGAERAAPGN